MNKNRNEGEPKFTPENTKAWTLALYPAAILLVAVYMIVTERPITTDVIGLFLGLLTAGSLQAAVKKGVKNVYSNDSNDSSGGIRSSGNKELGDSDRGRTNNFNRWVDRYINNRRRYVGRLPARGS